MSFAPLCRASRDISEFSGLERTAEDNLEPADFRAPAVVCATCIGRMYPQWIDYMSTADVPAIADSQRPSKNEYAATVRRMILEALAGSQEPLHYSRIAAYVRKRCAIRGRSPELTILGYLAKEPATFRQVSKHVFELSGRAKPRDTDEGAA